MIINLYIVGHSTSQSQIRPQVTAAPPISVKQDIQNNVQNQHQQYKVSISPRFLTTFF